MFNGTDGQWPPLHTAFAGARIARPPAGKMFHVKHFAGRTFSDIGARIKHTDNGGQLFHVKHFAGRTFSDIGARIKHTGTGVPLFHVKHFAGRRALRVFNGTARRGRRALQAVTLRRSLHYTPFRPVSQEAVPFFNQTAVKRYWAFTFPWSATVMALSGHLLIQR